MDLGGGRGMQIKIDKDVLRKHLVAFKEFKCWGSPQVDVISERLTQWSVERMSECLKTTQK